MDCSKCRKNKAKDFYLMEKIDGKWLPVVEEWLNIKGFVMLTTKPSEESIAADHILDSNGFDREWFCSECFKKKQKKFLTSSHPED